MVDLETEEFVLFSECVLEQYKALVTDGHWDNRWLEGSLPSQAVAGFADSVGQIGRIEEKNRETGNMTEWRLKKAKHGTSLEGLLVAGREEWRMPGNADNLQECVGVCSE